MSALIYSYHITYKMKEVNKTVDKKQISAGC